MRRCFEQVFEFAQSVGPDGVPLIADQVIRHGLVLAQIDIEVIEPEIGHHFLELSIRIDIAREALGDELFGDGALRVFERADGLLHFGTEAGDESGALRASEGLEEFVELSGLHGAEADDALLRRKRQNGGDMGRIDS